MPVKAFIISGKTFMLVLGVQKGGTTRLASELQESKACFPFGKEGHVLNNIEKWNLGDEKTCLL